MKGPDTKEKKDHVTVNVVGHFSDIMLGKVVNPKYTNPRSIVVTVNIKSVSIVRARQQLLEDARFWKESQDLQQSCGAGEAQRGQHNVET